MSLKAKLTTTLAALCMVICLLSVGVWAATQATVNFSGTVTFELRDVQVSVYGAYKGTGEDTDLGSADTDAIAEGEDELIVTWTAEDEDATEDPADEDNMLDKDWEFNALNFENKNSTIVIALKVKNNNPDNGVYATFTPSVAAALLTKDEGENLGGKNVTAWYSVAGATEVVDADDNVHYLIAENGAVAVFRIHIKVTNQNLAVTEAPVSGTLLLQDAESFPVTPKAAG